MKGKNEKPPKLDVNKDDENSPNKNSARFFDLAVFLLVFLLLAPITTNGQIYKPENDRIIVIPIKGMVDSGLSFFVQRIIRKASQEKVKALVLEITSDGGLINSSKEIKNALLDCKVPTIAYINGQCLSAAALVALACHKIAMEPGSTIGAATPIILMGNAVKAAEEKFVSAFRQEFEGTAEARKRPRELAGAMVDKNHDSIPGLVQRGAILTLTTETAQSHGMCDVISSSLSYALQRLKLEPYLIERIEPTSGETFARYLTDPNISVLLFTGGVWCVILEFLVFGWGVLGWIGLALLGLFFGGHLFAYLAGMEALLLFVIGTILLLLEIFVIPGFGITGVSGILSVSMSVVLVFGGVSTAVYAIAKMMAISIVMVTAVYFVGPRIHLFDRLILKKQISTAEGFVAVDLNQFDHLLNLEGTTVSACHPSGVARINNQRVDVVSEGEFIERNKPITVVAVQGTKIVVRELNA